MNCESIRHVFFQCERAKNIWRCLGLLDDDDAACVEDREGASVLSSLLLDKDEKCPLMPEVGRNDLIATTMWYIWWERRQFTHGECSNPGDQLFLCELEIYGSPRSPWLEEAH
jgi:hypothetical protein